MPSLLSIIHEPLMSSLRKLTQINSDSPMNLIPGSRILPLGALPQTPTLFIRHPNLGIPVPVCEASLSSHGLFITPNENMFVQATDGTIFEYKGGTWVKEQIGEYELPTKIESPQTEIKLTSDQTVAWAKLTQWLLNNDRYFLLRGYAGTGKSFMMQMLNKHLPGDCYFTAPTNKAAKVLASMIGIEPKTVYSLFGLRMSADEDELVLVSSGKPVYLPRGSVIVIDEAYQLSKLVTDIIDETAKQNGLKIIFVGDPAQLPPINGKSPITKIVSKDNRAMLKEVVRYDNELLNVATKIRDRIKEKNYKSPIKDDNSNGEGVFKLKSETEFIETLKKTVTLDYLKDCKVVAWRNKTVNKYNKIIRTKLGYRDDYVVNELIALTAPLYEDDSVVAHTETEFLITKVDSGSVKIRGTQIPVYHLSVESDEISLVLKVAKDTAKLQSILNTIANEAKASWKKERAILWKEFWQSKQKFAEIRYNYALTAHRAQGSTYKEVWIDQQDILANPKSEEAFKCLYVASTRPTSKLYTF